MPSIGNVMNCIDKSLAERDGNVDKFSNHLDKDIVELNREVKEVKTESQVMCFPTNSVARKNEVKKWKSKKVKNWKS